MSNAFALLLLSTAACSAAEAGGGGNTTPYSCDGVVAAKQTPDVDPKVVAPWHKLATAKTVNIPWALTAQMLANVSLPPLTLRGTIQLQHQMLLVAQRLDHARRSNPTFHGAHQAVMDRILSIAPPKEDFAQLGNGSRPDVHAILGPATGIVERATSTCGSGNSVHANHFGGLLAFRPLRSDTTRALVAQIVAFDNEGMPHITPIVEGIELRRGLTADAPACVVQARPDGTLHAKAHREIEEHGPFIEKMDNGVTCNRCHRTAADVGGRDLRAREVSYVDRQRDAQVERLATNLWNSFEWKLNWGTVAVDSAP